MKLVADTIQMYRSEEGKLVLAITGDITTKGQKYSFEEAAACVQNEIIRVVCPDLVVCCPGNHDITSRQEPYFSHFNEFSFRISGRADQVFSTSRTTCSSMIGGYGFIAANSSYHGDHRKGEVVVADLEFEYLKVSSEWPIVLLHHSPLSSTYGGASLVNGYEFLAWAARREILAILHGHIHAEQVLRVGSRPTALLGVGSLMFEPDPNYNNQFCISEYDEGVLKSVKAFRYFGDRRKFEEMSVPWV